MSGTVVNDIGLMSKLPTMPVKTRKTLPQEASAQPLVGSAETREPAMSDFRHLRRVGPDGGTGWNVCLNRSHQSFRKRFADSKYGGVEGALTAAKAWRDEMDRLHPRMTKRQVAALHKPSLSGRQGVIRVVIREYRKDGRCILAPVWEAGSPAWHTPIRNRRFSVAKYGEEEALRLAVAAREAFEAEAEAAGQQPLRRDQVCRKPVTLRNIHRSCQGECVDKAWVVIVKRASLAAPLNKRFPDRAYGNEAAALAAAMRWRDEMDERHPRLDSKSRLSRLTKASTSGVKGVFQQYTPRQLADGSTRVSTFWSAKTPSGVKPEVTRSFSIEKYGEREAFRMAVEARRAFEAQLLAGAGHE